MHDRRATTRPSKTLQERYHTARRRRYTDRLMRRIAAAIRHSVGRRRRAAARERGARRESSGARAGRGHPDRRTPRRRACVAARGGAAGRRGRRAEDHRPRRRGRLPAHAAPAHPLPFRQPFIDGRRGQAARHRSAEPARPARRDPLRHALGRQRLRRRSSTRSPASTRSTRRPSRRSAVEGDRYPPPPAELFGDDGVAHFRWVFARNHDLCGDGAVRRVEAPLAQALPRLFVQGRIKEALLRAARDARGRFAATRSARSRRPGWNGRRRIRPPTRAPRRRCFDTATSEMQAKALPADQAGARAQGDRGHRGARRWAPTPTAGGAELDPAGFCDLLGGAKALREGDPAAREQAMILLRDSGVKLPQDSPCAKALTENAGDTRHAGAACARSVAGDAGRDDRQRARQAGARVDGGQGRRRPRGRRDRVRQAGRRASGAVPAAAAAAGFVARRARGRGGRPGARVRRPGAALRAADVQGARRPRAGGDGARAGTPEVAGVGRHAGQDDGASGRRAAPGRDAGPRRPQGRSGQGAAREGVRQHPPRRLRVRRSCAAWSTPTRRPTSC